MSDFPKYPTDFIALTRGFEDEDLEKILQLPVKTLSWLIDTLKLREVNASNSRLDQIRRIEAKIQSLEEDLNQARGQGSNSAAGVIEDQISLLKEML